MKKTLVSFLTFCLFLLPTAALAKGGFTYVEVKGPGLTGSIAITDPALTEDFFAFADFTAGPVPAPTDPGEGYLVTRVYVIEDKDHPFDQLEYYPYSGYVHYIGLAEGVSEYDGSWFIASPAAAAPFRAALKAKATLTWAPFAAFLIIMAAFYLAYRNKPAGSNN
ncbi:MAG: hypothetical protein HFACDABA_00004 [Anaerolineales bacterium]|nr:hypothetical protein [Anaerolineales bacterium]